MEDEVFHGYYGKNYVMTNCLVLLEEDLSQEEIGDCLELVKKIDTGFFGVKSGDALAARTKDSPWLGIARVSRKTAPWRMPGRCQKYSSRMSFSMTNLTEIC